MTRWDDPYVPFDAVAFDRYVRVGRRDRRRRLERLARDLGLQVGRGESLRALERRVADRARLRWGSVIR